jgi:Spherulation-specific family 4
MNRFLRNAASFAAICVTSVAQATPLELIVPAYFYPSFSGSHWDQLTAQAAAGTPITAIMNPGSGPGAAVNSDYTAAITTFRAAGGKVLGYVPTGYAGASVNAGASCQPAVGTTYTVSDVTACAQQYKNFYAVDGIFLDEFTNTSGIVELNFYRQIYQNLKGAGGIDPTWRIMGNPGTSVPPEYFANGQLTADTIVSFEQIGANYVNYAPAPGAATGSPSQFAHLVYNVAGPLQAEAFVARVSSLGVGSIFVTNDNFCQGAALCTNTNSDFNPWDTLPGYWNELNAQVRAINAGGNNSVPAPAPLLAFALGLSILGARFRQKK